MCFLILYTCLLYGCINKNTAWCTHLDLDILAVDDLYDADDIVKHQAHFLTVVWWRETKHTYLDDICKSCNWGESISGKQTWTVPPPSHFLGILLVLSNWMVNIGNTVQGQRNSNTCVTASQNTTNFLFLEHRQTPVPLALHLVLVPPLFNHLADKWLFLPLNIWHTVLFLPIVMELILPLTCRVLLLHLYA